MAHLTSQQLIILLLQLSLLLGAALALGELARLLRQPAIVGETVAGILLGPSVLGAISPDMFHALFPQSGPSAVALDTFVAISVVLLLLVAGLEMDLSAMVEHGRRALLVSLLGIVAPFALGGAAAYYWPQLMGKGPDTDTVTFAIFFATALSISALPVVAKTLMDLDLLRTELGVLVITSAMVNDLVGWIIFSVVLSMMGAGGHGYGVGTTILLTFLIMAVMLLVVRPLVNRVLPWVQSRLVYPGGVLGFALVLTFAGAAATEMVGIHAVFGAFLIGIAFGDSPHMRQRTREIINYFISHIFAPIFFAAIGLYADVIGDFDLLIVTSVLVLAIAGKVFGGYLGARWGGMDPRPSWAAGFGLNARGAMGIIMALLALQNKVISEEGFVALVIMSLLTSVASGPVMDRLMRRRRKATLMTTMDARAFVSELHAENLQEAINELVPLAAKRSGRSPEEIAEAVMYRERIGATVVEHGIAIPHARLANLKTPLVAIGRSKDGVACEVAGGEPVHFVFLLLSPLEEPMVQLELLGDISTHFREDRIRKNAMAAATYSEFRAQITVADSEAEDASEEMSGQAAT